jgi:hypothetical protein
MHAYHIQAHHWFWVNLIHLGGQPIIELISKWECIPKRADDDSIFLQKKLQSKKSLCPDVST